MGRIVIDANNPIEAPLFKPVDLNGRVSSEVFADLLERKNSLTYVLQPARGIAIARLILAGSVKYEEFFRRE